MKCHFVYVVPDKTLLGRFNRKICLWLQRFYLPVCWFGNRNKTDTSWWPEKSPIANTKHIFQGLSSLTPTLLYDIREQVRCQFSPDDIFLGHPSFPYRPGRKGVTELSIAQGTRPQVFALISPLHCNIDIQTNHINKQYLDAVGRLLEHADILFAIMGQYWWDQWPNSPFAHWIPKMVRLDMAIDTNLFPHVKKRFNPPGRRGFLYIGRSNRPEKGTDFLSKLARRLPKYRWGWIGNGPEIEGVALVSTSRSLTPDFMSTVAEDFDFFVSTSVADANPTTILESMAWGFPVVCTPQSGYYETSYRKNIYHDNFDRSIDVLSELEFAEENKLQQMADEARIVVEQEYTWDRFVSVIYKQLGLE